MDDSTLRWLERDRRISCFDTNPQSKNLPTLQHCGEPERVLNSQGRNSAQKQTGFRKNSAVLFEAGSYTLRPQPIRKKETREKARFRDSAGFVISAEVFPYLWIMDLLQKWARV